MNESPLLRNPALSGQVKDFSRLVVEGKKYPMDIDGFYDDGGRRFIFFETKYGSKMMERGQERAYEALARACQLGGVDAWVVQTYHRHPEGTVIDLGRSTTLRIHHKGEWFVPAFHGESAADTFFGILDGTYGDLG